MFSIQFIPFHLCLQVLSGHLLNKIFLEDSEEQYSDIYNLQLDYWLDEPSINLPGAAK